MYIVIHTAHKNRVNNEQARENVWCSIGRFDGNHVICHLLQLAKLNSFLKEHHLPTMGDRVQVVERVAMFSKLRISSKQ